MSIDKEKLKALAEAATVGRNYDRLDSAGGGLKYTCTGDDGSLVLQVDHKNDEFGFIGPNHQADEAFFLSATPAAVLSLLAEIDQLNAENEALRKDAERYRGVRRVANRQGFTDEKFDQQTDTRIASFDAAMAKESP